MKELKTNKGITLIALIVTIIVLLILAVVTIKLLVDNGIVGRATGAKNKYKVAEEKELIQLAYSDYKMGVSEGGPISEDRSLLERYFLGENKQGNILENLRDEPDGSNYGPVYMPDIKFKDNKIIKDASTSITLLGYGENGLDMENSFIKYNNNIWSFTSKNLGSSVGNIIVNLEFITTISSNNKNEDEIDLLERYFLGEDKTGLDLNTLFNLSAVIGSSGTNEMSDVKFNNNSIIKDANTNISIIAFGGYNTVGYCIVRYKENFYKLFVDETRYGYNSNEMFTTKIEFLTSIQKLRDSQLQVKGATVVGDENTGWTITFDKTGNVYTLASSGNTSSGIDKTEDLALLRKYFLGKNGEGKLVKDVCYNENYDKPTSFGDTRGFKNDNNSIKKAAIEISFVFSEYETYKFENINIEKNNNYIKYNDVVYKVEINKEGRIIGVETEYMPTGREGQTIPYSIDGTKENEKEWTILYDYGDTVEIISPDVMGELSTGCDDEEAQNPGDIDKNGEANTDLDKAIYSYNNVVSRINRYAESQVTNTNKISVRSVGSNPENPNAEAEMYTSSNLEKWHNGIYNGLGKGIDNNFKDDYIRMKYFKVNKASEYEGYCLPTRWVEENPNGVVSFGIRRTYPWDGSLGYVEEWYTGKDGFYHSGGGWKVRPVVKINLPV